MLDERTCLNVCAGACVFVAILVLRIWYEGYEVRVKVNIIDQRDDDLYDDEDDDDWWKRPKRVED